MRLGGAAIPTRSFPPSGNRLIAALPSPARAEIEPFLEEVALQQGEVLVDAGEPVRHVYFPYGGIVSLTAVTASGDTAETGTVGNEGMIGISALVGADSALSRYLVRVSGQAARLASDRLQRLLERSPALRAVLNAYMRAFIVQLLQSVACNALHTVEQRCCRWLLMTHDRIGEVSFALTQEFLAEMLGVRRSSVSLVAATLQRKGLIRYHRGRMTIIDRRGLERRACDCYEVIRRSYEQLGPPRT
jgi:CRP-like cAMP-binding protein